VKDAGLDEPNALLKENTAVDLPFRPEVQSPGIGQPVDRTFWAIALARRLLRLDD